MSIDVLAVRPSLLAVGPRDPEVLKQVRIEGRNRGSLWQAQPYLHEYSLAFLYLGLEERQRQFTENDRDSLTKVFGWLVGFNQKSFPKVEKLPDRPEPLFIDTVDRGKVTSIFNFLRDEDFFRNYEAYRYFTLGMIFFAQKLASRQILSADFDKAYQK